MSWSIGRAIRAGMIWAGQFGYLRSSTRGGLAHIKKDRLSTRFFAAILKEVAAVQFGNVPHTVWYWCLQRPPYAK